jgi:hypothetical protein
MVGNDISFHLNRLPAPISDCNFLLDFSGRDLSIDAWTMRVGDSPLKIKGTLKGWDGLKGDVFVHSEYLKMADLTPIRREGPPGEKKSDIEKILDTLDIYIKLVALRGRWKEFDWGPMRADMDLTSGDLYIKSLRTRLDHGTFNTSGHIKRNGKKEIYFSSHIWLSEQPIRDLFEGFSLESDYINGKMDLEAFLIMVGKEKKDLIPSLSGTANMLIKKGTIKKSNAFIKILDFLSLRKIFKRKPSNLPKDGFYFEQITGYAVIDDGVLESENFLMKSPVYNAVATGRVDLSKREIQATLGVQPLETIDTLLSKIPILGYALTGEDQSFLTYYFMVRGPMKSPDINYVPFKNLGSGVGNVLKRLFLTPFRLYEDLSNMPKISSDSPGQGNPVAERGRFSEEKE